MTSLKKVFNIFLGAALTVAVGFTGVVNAQSFVLEELIVTARKVEESIQDVPASITAFSAEDIANRSIEELEDVAILTPGLTFEDYSNGGFGTPVIRGGSQFNITQLEQNVSTFLDGVYIPRSYAVDIGTMNLERIEVVKGPQSALYGANAFLGAINYVSKSANLEEFEGDVSLTVGTDGRFDVSGAISIPIVAEKVALRVAAGASEFDGDFDNNHPDANAGVSPGTDDSIGGWDKDSIEVGLVAQPTDALKLHLNYHSFDTESESRAQYRITRGSGTTNCSDALLFGFLPVQNLFCGEIPEEPVGGNGFVLDPRTFGLISETDIVRAGFSWDITDAISLSYQFANIEGEVFSAGGSDFDPLVPTVFFGLAGNSFSSFPVGNFDYDSHELKLEFTGDSGFYGMVGVYSSDGEDIDDGGGGLVPFRGLDPIINGDFIFFDGFASRDTEVDAIFGRVEFPLFDDKLIVSAEGRFTDESKVVVVGEMGTAFTYEEDYFTPRVSLDYKVNDDQSIYFSVAQGVKAGGVNDNALVETERFFDTDENTTFELGSKNVFLDGALQLNATLFLVDWSDLQTSASPTGGSLFDQTVTVNTGGAESKGLELDFLYAISESFTINGGIALIDATYDDGTISARIARNGSCDGIVCNANGDIGGNELPRSSDTQWNLGGEYRTETSGGLEYFFRADLAGQSEQYVAEQNTATIPSRTLLNLRAGIGTDVWSAELWVTNATDEEYVSNAFFIANPFQSDYVPTLGNARRIGITVDYSF